MILKSLLTRRRWLRRVLWLLLIVMFADSRKYDQAQLCAGFIAAVEAVRERTGAGDAVPVWYGGWSTGAEQSVAAAACANRLPQLVGLLLAAPGTRGRYGITSSDLLGGTPTGPDSFALADMVMPLKRAARGAVRRRAGSTG